MSPQTQANSETAIDTLPAPFQAAGIVGALEQIKHGSFCGWVGTEAESGVVSISLFEGDACLATVAAGIWREDVARLRNGSGHCGFQLTIPDALYDGRLHEVDFRLADTGRSILARPVRLLPGHRPAEKFSASQADPVAGAVGNRGRAAPAVKLSVIVNFYNMQREAARTLTSLTRSYQRGVEDVSYEVLCIDNGSEPPLQAEWVASFGPEFRLFTPSRLLPSPCAAINEAAAQARGEFLAIMIDGAHLLTPGVLAEAMMAIAESPNAIVAVRYWFVGGDQRWLHAAGYTREMEDKVFARIHWPNHGYGLFDIGVPIIESPSSWLDGMFESNCLFLPAQLFDRLGGYDENFSEPGAGFANMDLFRRAASAAEDGVVGLIGEASFHQYHEGTTTNVVDDEKDKRVRAYASAYRELRGTDFKSVGRTQIRFRGSIKNEAAVRTMRGTYVPAHVAVTDQIRPSRVYPHYDGAAQRYLQATYAECGLHRLATWRGAPVGVAPADLLNIQEIIRQTQPDCVVTTSADDGLVRFLDDVLKLLGREQARIVRVMTAASRAAAPPRVTAIVGKHDAPETIARIESEVVACDTTLVLYASAVALPADTLHLYSKFVTNGSYLIFLGTVFGQPWLGYSKKWNLPGIKNFLLTAPFKVEPSWERQLLTTCPSGYLHRIDTPGKYDASLDQLDLFESTLP